LNLKPQKVIQSIKRLGLLPPNGWRPGSGKVGQGGLKVFHLWHHSHKTRIPQA